MKKGKFLIDAYKKINDKSFNIDEAVQFFVDSKRDKFDETIEISMNLGVDPRHADQMVRGVVSLPHGLDPILFLSALSPHSQRYCVESAPPVSTATELERTPAAKSG